MTTWRDIKEMFLAAKGEQEIKNAALVARDWLEERGRTHLAASFFAVATTDYWHNFFRNLVAAEIQGLPGGQLNKLARLELRELGSEATN